MTGIILKIGGISDLDCSLEFYIERENALRFKKEELTRVLVENGDAEYYALIDADLLGRGHLMCRVEIVDKEMTWCEKTRPVVVTGFTGYTIPCMGEGRSISCGDYVVSFEKVSDVPVNVDAKIYIGSVKEWITGYEYLTETMVKGLSAKNVAAERYMFNVTQGDRLVVAVPYDRDLKACKDNGFGEMMPFSTSVMGANGDIELVIDGVRYKIYGEFITVSGVIFVYVV